MMWLRLPYCLQLRSKSAQPKRYKVCSFSFSVKEGVVNKGNKLGSYTDMYKGVIHEGCSGGPSRDELCLLYLNVLLFMSLVFVQLLCLINLRFKLL